MATQNDLAVGVMQELGLLVAGTSPTSSDYNDITLRYKQRLVMLQDEDYADWDANSIPDAAMPGLIRVMAYECANMFGINKAGLLEHDGTTLEQRGLSMLRRYMRKKPTYEPVRADYF